MNSLSVLIVLVIVCLFISLIPAVFLFNRYKNRGRIKYLFVSIATFTITFFTVFWGVCFLLLDWIALLDCK